MRADIHGGRGQKRSTQGLDTEAQDSIPPSHFSACNARPVHTAVPHPDYLTEPYTFRRRFVLGRAISGPPRAMRACRWRCRMVPKGAPWPPRGQSGIERRLAAILAANIAGYSPLMGADETGTARALREHRAAIDPIVASHGGRIVKTTGDGEGLRKAGLPE